VTGGGGSVDLAGALREARTNQFTTNNGARLGVPNIAVILTSTTSYLSRQVSHSGIDIVRYKSASQSKSKKVSKHEIIQRLNVGLHTSVE